MIARGVFSIFLLAAVSFAAPARETDRAFGTVQREIRLQDGRVFRNTKVLDASIEKGTATLSDSRRIRTVPLAQLPDVLREQVVAELARGAGPRYNTYRPYVRPPPPPPDQVIAPSPPPSDPAAATITDQLIAQATRETPDELRLYLLATTQRVSSLTTKIRKVEQVPGWQKIRATGDASVAVWDASRRDYLWRTEKFEVEFDILDGTTLRADRVTFGGISRAIGPH